MQKSSDNRKLKKRIAITIVDGYHIRYFVETDIVRKLANAGFDIILLIPSHHMEDVRHILSTDISFMELPIEPFHLAEKFLIYLYSGMFRSQYAGQSQEFIYRRRKDDKSFSYKSEVICRYLLERYIARCFRSEHIIRLIRKKLIRKNPSSVILNIVQSLRPDILVSSSPGFKFMDIPILRSCRYYKIPTICPILSWDNLSSKGPMLAKVNRLIVWNHQMAEEAVTQHGYQPKDIEICGAPQFDIYAKINSIEVKRRLIEKYKEIMRGYERVVTFTSIPLCFYPSIPELVLRIYQILRSDSFPYKAFFIIRPHPQQDTSIFSIFDKMPGVKINSPGKYTTWKRSRAGIQWHPGKNNMLQLMELMAFSDLAITIASSTTLDAAAVDTPVLNIGFDPVGKMKKSRIKQLYSTSHYTQVVQSKAIPLVTSDKELKEAMVELMQHPSKFSVQRRRMVEKICGPLDGRAAERQTNAILKFVLECGKGQLPR